MPFIAPNGSVIVTVPVGQKIAVGHFGPGAAIVSYSNAPSNQPEQFTENSRANNSSLLLGTFGADRNVKIESIGNAEVEYAIAVDPVLTKNFFANSNFIDKSGTPGNVTINSLRGRAAVAAAATSLVITNNLVTVNSTVLVSQQQDSTATLAKVTPGAGTITINMATAPTANTKVDFVVFNG